LGSRSESHLKYSKTNTNLKPKNINIFNLKCLSLFNYLLV